jgi:hypothetical protein
MLSSSVVLLEVYGLGADRVAVVGFAADRETGRAGLDDGSGDRRGSLNVTHSGLLGCGDCDRGQEQGRQYLESPHSPSPSCSCSCRTAVVDVDFLFLAFGRTTTIVPGKQCQTG